MRARLRAVLQFREELLSSLVLFKRLELKLLNAAEDISVVIFVVIFKHKWFWRVHKHVFAFDGMNP